MSNFLTQEQHESIRRLIEAHSMPKTEIARRFNCSRQTIARIAHDVELKNPKQVRSAREAAAKKELDAAFGAFEFCNSPANYRRLNDARYDYEFVCGPLAKYARRDDLAEAS